MNKEFVPYELAVRLKAIDFDEPCIATYGYLDLYINTDDGHLKAPTFSQAFRWFREKYNLKSFIQPIPDDVDTYIFAYGTKEIEHDDEDYLKYEEAELACLTKLIEIVETKSE